MKNLLASIWKIFLNFICSMHYMQEEGIQYSVGNINMIFFEANKDSWLVLRRTIPSKAPQGNCCNIIIGITKKKPCFGLMNRIWLIKTIVTIRINLFLFMKKCLYKILGLEKQRRDLCCVSHAKNIYHYLCLYVIIM